MAERLKSKGLDTPDEGESSTSKCGDKRTDKDDRQRFLSSKASQAEERCFESGKIGFLKPTIFMIRRRFVHLSTRRVPLDRVASGN